MCCSYTGSLRRTHKLKEKRHSQIHWMNGRKTTSMKHSLPPQENEGLEIMAVKETGSCYVIGCMLNVERTVKLQVKIIVSAKEGYLSTFVAACLSQCPIFSIDAFFGLVARLMALPGTTITLLMPETVYRQVKFQSLLSSMHSLVMASMLYTGTIGVRPFFNWLQACSKGLPSTDQAHARDQDTIDTSYDLYCSLVKTLHLSGMRCFNLYYISLPKNQLTIWVNKNQDGKSKKCLEYKMCEDPCLDTEISKPECIQMGDNSKTQMKTKQTTTGRQKRPRKVYKLAPTFQHPRILSQTQLSTWECSRENGTSDLHAKTNATLAMQNLLKDDIRKMIPDKCKDDLLEREKNHATKDGITYEMHLIQMNTMYHSDSSEQITSI